MLAKGLVSCLRGVGAREGVPDRTGTAGRIWEFPRLRLALELDLEVGREAAESSFRGAMTGAEKPGGIDGVERLGTSSSSSRSRGGND
jgi:hypothetical protein